MANSKKRCTGCKKYFPADHEGSISPGPNFFHNRRCALAHLDKLQDKRSNYAISAEQRWAIEAKKKAAAKRKADKQSSKELRDFNRKDVRWQHKLTQKAFNRMRVLEEMKWFSDRGLEPTCISCNKPNMDWCCGHLKTVGAHGSLRYNRYNTKLQCNRYCNKGLSGNINGNKNTRGYMQGIIERFGYEIGGDIIDCCDQDTMPRKWQWEELEQMRAEFNKRIRELEI